jgi:hypothetical protein
VCFSDILRFLEYVLYTFFLCCLFKEQVDLGLGANSLRWWVRGEGFLVAYFAVLLFSLVGLVLQSGVFVFIGSVCLLCLVFGWFGSDNYRYHTKYV